MIFREISIFSAGHRIYVRSRLSFTIDLSASIIVGTTKPEIIPFSEINGSLNSTFPDSD